MTEQQPDSWDVYAQGPPQTPTPEPTTWEVYGDAVEPSVNAQGADHRISDHVTRQRAELRRLAQRTPQDPKKSPGNKPGVLAPASLYADEDTPRSRLNQAMPRLLQMLVLVVVLVVAGASYAQYQRTQERLSIARSTWIPGFERPDRADVGRADLTVDFPGWHRSGGENKRPDDHGVIASALWAKGDLRVFARARYSNDAQPFTGSGLRQFDDVVCGDRSEGGHVCAAPMNRGHIVLSTMTQPIPMPELAEMTAQLYLAQL